ncbi:MAG: hypothetical protein MUC68_07605 [Burkholderiaceae bacterium]|nr:hypothetical protein [Burkholderiaceae bacterium]
MARLPFVCLGALLLASLPLASAVAQPADALLLASLPLASAVAQPADAPPRLVPGTPAAAPTVPVPVPLRDATPAPSRATVPTAPTAPIAPTAPTGAPALGPIIEDEALEDLPPARITSPEARIEQRRQGNRTRSSIAKGSARCRCRN